jgi:hypothetical protein
MANEKYEVGDAVVISKAGSAIVDDHKAQRGKKGVIVKLSQKTNYGRVYSVKVKGFRDSSPWYGDELTLITQDFKPPPYGIMLKGGTSVKNKKRKKAIKARNKRRKAEDLNILISLQDNVN